MYAIGGSANPTINSQGNRYLAPINPFAKEVILSPYGFLMSNFLTQYKNINDFVYLFYNRKNGEIV